MYEYQAYGLKIHSEIELPELVPQSSQSQPDIIIGLRKLSDSPLKTESVSHVYQLTPQGFYVYWDMIGTFAIPDIHHLWIDCDPDADQDRLRLFILGAAIGVMLHMRSLFVLHASAVVIQGQAVVFMGNKGWGKSTLAATLKTRGHVVLGDDVIAIDLSNPKQPVVIPSFPQIKLWPDAVAALYHNSDQAQPLVNESSKQQVQFHDTFEFQSIPLGQFFVLGKSDPVEIAGMTIQDTIQYLLQNTYVARFQDALLQGEAAQKHFAQLTTLANTIPTHRLLRPTNLDLLHDVAELVEAHLLTQAQQTQSIAADKLNEC